MPRTAAALSLAAILLTAGCKSSPAPTGSATNPSTSSHATPPVFTPPAVPASQLGIISGTVKFTGVAPARVHIDMSMDPACAFGPDNMSEPYVIDKGHVANVYVYVKSGAPETLAAPSATPGRIDQNGCRFTPHVVAIQQGATVSFSNSDSTMHNIHIVPTNPGNRTVDISQPPQSPAQSATFSAPETMIAVRCNNHPWMNAFLNVAPNPYFAVTGPDGTFRIPSLPPGHYTLAAVHEKLGEQDIPVTVTAGGTVQADFTYTASTK